MQHNNKIKNMTKKIILCASCLVLGHAFARATPGDTADNVLAQVVKRISPAVVNLQVAKNPMPASGSAADDNTPPALRNMVTGSGVIIDAKNGYIVTNAHVVNNSKLIIVTLQNNARYIGHPIGMARNFDLAVIKINAKKLTAMPVGNSSLLKVGEPVAAIGSPFGLRQTVTAGIISSLNRNNPRLSGNENFIQTDAPINPGNSGGPLINLKGQLIGINTALLAPLPANVGIGFAIPSNIVTAASTQLIKYGSIKGGALGVMAQNLTNVLSHALKLPDDTRGVIITHVVPNSPAEKAGIKAEDIITQAGGNNIQNALQLHNLLALSRPDSQLTLHLLHNGKKKTVTVTVGSPKALLASNPAPLLTGMRLQAFRQLQPDNTVIQGMAILSLSPSTPGGLAGLIPGDIILTANDQPVKNIKQLMQACRQSDKPVLLKVARGNGTLYIVLSPIK